MQCGYSYVPRRSGRESFGGCFFRQRSFFPNRGHVDLRRRRWWKFRIHIRANLTNGPVRDGFLMAEFDASGSVLDGASVFFSMGPAGAFYNDEGCLPHTCNVPITYPVTLGVPIDVSLEGVMNMFIRGDLDLFSSAHRSAGPTSAPPPNQTPRGFPHSASPSWQRASIADSLRKTGN